MGTLWAKLLNSLGLAYWLTIETQTANQRQSHSFGPFITSGAAIAAQDDYCQSLLQAATGKLTINTVRVSMER